MLEKVNCSKIIFLFYLFHFFLGQSGQASNLSFEKIQSITQLSPEILKKLEQENYLSQCTVDSKEGKRQSLNFRLLGLHPQSCQRILPKLARYEDYSSYIDFIKLAQYDEKTQTLLFNFDSPLLPFPLALTFKLPRIRKPGVYPYIFTKGIFPNLQGEIHVDQGKENKRCLFFMTAHWVGPTTQIPNTIIEIFVQTLAQRGLEKLFRISSY